MVGIAICFSYCGFLPIVEQHRSVLTVDFLAASLQEEEAAWTSLSTLEVVLASSTMALLVM
jgi:hypothetical protein